jgi:hypothetical protein
MFTSNFRNWTRNSRVPDPDPAKVPDPDQPTLVPISHEFGMLHSRSFVSVIIYIESSPMLSTKIFRIVIFVCRGPGHSYHHIFVYLNNLKFSKENMLSIVMCCLFTVTLHLMLHRYNYIFIIIFVTFFKIFLTIYFCVEKSKVELC